MRSLFIVNRRSGRRKASLEPLIRSTCAGWPDVEVRGCERKEDLDEIIEDARVRGVEAVFAVGGDGTVHEIARRLIDSPLALGIVPAGSGNGFARHIGLSMKPVRAILSSRDGTVVRVDTAVVNEKPFLAIAGVGFDAQIAHDFAESGARGLRTYLKTGFRRFLSVQPEEYRVTVDGTTISASAYVVAVANSAQYGNEARIAPLASVRDGLLDVVIVRNMSVMTAPMQLFRLFRGTLHDSADVQTLRGREVVVERAAAGVAHVDGEPLVLPALLTIRVRPLSLRLVVPLGIRAI